VEPLTVITLIASKYGVSRLVGALTGEQDLGGLAAEVVGALAESESRLAERLAGIEQLLDEVLEQRYATAVTTGLRTLVDAGTASDPEERREELLRARDLFREASSSARSKIQEALAERYTLLCSMSLGRIDAARNALRRLNGAATDAPIEAAGTSMRTWSLAEAHVELQGSSGGRTGREEQVSEQFAFIATAAREAGDLAGKLLQEALVLGECLGDDAMPRLHKDEIAEVPIVAGRLAPNSGAMAWPPGRLATVHSRHELDRCVLPGMISA